MPAETIPTTLLGRTNLSVSKICFGTSSLGDMPGTYGYGVDEERARDTITAIFRGPANFLDTSRIYGMGRSEERIGDVIRQRGGLPQGSVVSTKLDRDPQTNRFDAAQARRSLDESLKALGLERIDILHLHDPEHADSLEGTCGPKGALPELFRMKEEGLVKAVGLAAGSVDIMMPLLRDWDFDVLITHNRFTLTNRNADAMIDFARSRGIAVLNAAPYAGGVLAKGSSAYPRYVYQEASEEVLDPVRRIEAICARHGVPPGAAALQFSMRDERITSTICGVSKPERVEQTIEWACWPIPDAMWEELASLPFSTEDPEANRQYNPG
ncbi:aldo/keto reductase [Microvirga sp. GCM10011540]|uniref:aldo/keto reductase n=1 Tax=Microvirga sp. GCM10011540 TaxID=3317338 RepID=UPI00361F9AE1